MALAWVAIAGCGSVPAGGAGETLNVSGTIDRGPIATCPADEPCDPPAVATALVFTGSGGSSVSARVAPDGSFALHLDPGEYAIAVAPPAFHGTLEPSSVLVPSNGSVVLRLRIVRSP